MMTTNAEVAAISMAGGVSEKFPTPTAATAQTLAELWERIGGRVLKRRKTGIDASILTNVDIASAAQNLSN